MNTINIKEEAIAENMMEHKSKIEPIEVNGDEFVPIERLKGHYGEDFEVHYHTSKLFGVKSLPFEIILLFLGKT